MSHDGDPNAPIYLALGITSCAVGIVAASKSFEGPSSFPFRLLAPLTALALAPIAYVWHVLPPRPKPRPRLIRIALGAFRKALWPIGIFTIAVLTGFVNSSLSGDSTRAGLTSTLGWAVWIGIIVAMGEAALVTLDLTMPATKGARDYALGRVRNLLPKGTGSRLGRAYEMLPRALAVATVGVATTWLGVIGSWTVLGAVLWQGWLAIDFKF